MIKGKNKYIEEKANFKNLCKISFVKFLKNCKNYWKKLSPQFTDFCYVVLIYVSNVRFLTLSLEVSPPIDPCSTSTSLFQLYFVESEYLIEKDDSYIYRLRFQHTTSSLTLSPKFPHRRFVVWHNPRLSVHQSVERTGAVHSPRIRNHRYVCM